MFIYTQRLPLPLLTKPPVLGSYLFFLTYSLTSPFFLTLTSPFFLTYSFTSPFFLI